MARVITTHYLPIPPTTGMPHRPSSSDGHTSIFLFSKPPRVRKRVSNCARRYAGLGLTTGGLGSGPIERGTSCVQQASRRSFAVCSPLGSQRRLARSHVQKNLLFGTWLSPREPR